MPSLGAAVVYARVAMTAPVPVIASPVALLPLPTPPDFGEWGAVRPGAPTDPPALPFGCCFFSSGRDIEDDLASENVRRDHKPQNPRCDYTTGSFHTAWTHCGHAANKHDAVQQRGMEFMGYRAGYDGVRQHRHLLQVLHKSIMLH